MAGNQYQSPFITPGPKKKPKGETKMTEERKLTIDQFLIDIEERREEAERASKAKEADDLRRWSAECLNIAQVTLGDIWELLELDERIKSLDKPDGLKWKTNRPTEHNCEWYFGVSHGLELSAGYLKVTPRAHEDHVVELKVDENGHYYKSFKKEFDQFIEASRLIYLDRKAQSERAKAQREEEARNEKKYAEIAKAYGEEIKAYWARQKQVADIHESNFEKIHERFNTPFSYWTIEYAIVAYHEEGPWAETRKRHVLFPEPDKNGYWDCITDNGKIEKMKYTHLVGISDAIQTTPREFHASRVVLIEDKGIWVSTVPGSESRELILAMIDEMEWPEFPAKFDNPSDLPHKFRRMAEAIANDNFSKREADNLGVPF